MSESNAPMIGGQPEDNERAPGLGSPHRKKTSIAIDAGKWRVGLIRDDGTIEDFGPIFDAPDSVSLMNAIHAQPEGIGGAVSLDMAALEFNITLTTEEMEQLFALLNSTPTCEQCGSEHLRMHEIHDDFGVVAAVLICHNCEASRWFYRRNEERPEASSNE